MKCFGSAAVRAIKEAQLFIFGDGKIVEFDKVLMESFLPKSFYIVSNYSMILKLIIYFGWIIIYSSKLLISFSIWTKSILSYNKMIALIYEDDNYGIEII